MKWGMEWSMGRSKYVLGCGMERSKYGVGYGMEYGEE